MHDQNSKANHNNNFFELANDTEFCLLTQPFETKRTSNHSQQKNYSKINLLSTQA